MPQWTGHVPQNHPEGWRGFLGRLVNISPGDPAPFFGAWRRVKKCTPGLRPNRLGIGCRKNIWGGKTRWESATAARGGSNGNDIPRWPAAPPSYDRWEQPRRLRRSVRAACRPRASRFCGTRQRTRSGLCPRGKPARMRQGRGGRTKGGATRNSVRFHRRFACRSARLGGSSTPRRPSPATAARRIRPSCGLASP